MYIFGDHILYSHTDPVYAVIFAGIIGFSGYWGCERCRTRGEYVQKPTTAEHNKIMTSGTGYGGGALLTDSADQAAAVASSGGSTVKFPQLYAKRRKDSAWSKYKDKERTEPSVSIVYIQINNIQLSTV